MNVFHDMINCMRYCSRFVHERHFLVNTFVIGEVVANDDISVRISRKHMHVNWCNN